MAGVTDLSFRLICREFGARFCFFEMLDVHSVVYGHPRSLRIIKTLKEDRPIAAQLLGSDPGSVLEAALKITGILKISLIDINAACPAKKVIRKKAGAYLLKDRGRLSGIIKRLSSGLKTPVTVKIRTNYGERDIKECLKTAEECEASGAQAVFIHGRTARQGYAGDVDYEAIKAVKERLAIPVIGSGNIFDPLSARMMLCETGCDGIMVARGALGRPWIFEEIDSFLENRRPLGPKTLAFKKKVLKRHLSYIERYKDLREKDKMGFMVKVAMWYLKGLPHAAGIRSNLCRVRSFRDLKRTVDNVGIEVRLQEI